MAIQLHGEDTHGRNINAGALHGFVQRKVLSIIRYAPIARLGISHRITTVVGSGLDGECGREIGRNAVSSAYGMIVLARIELDLGDVYDAA